MLKNNVRKENIAFEEGMGSGFVWFEKFLKFVRFAKF
jgi:hypothetical protein